MPRLRESEVEFSDKKIKVILKDGESGFQRLLIWMNLKKPLK